MAADEMSILRERNHTLLEIEAAPNDITDRDGPAGVVGRGRRRRGRGDLDLLTMKHLVRGDGEPPNPELITVKSHREYIITNTSTWRRERGFIKL